MDKQTPGNEQTWIPRPLLIVIGTIAVLLGLLGMFLPVLPTTPFLLLASYCYARSSQRMHNWLTTNQWYGDYIKNYQQGRGMTLSHMLTAISMLWLTTCYSVFYAVSLLWLKVLLLLIALGVTVHLIKINTYRPADQFPP